MAYHHRDLPAVVIAHALETIAESGPDALSMRDLARRAGVSHGAPMHHFGDKRGLLTAIATQGFETLTGALEKTRAEGQGFVELGVTYVTFALQHPAHFQVMFRPDLLDYENAELRAAGSAAKQILQSGRTRSDELVTGSTAAWSLVHGFATLWLAGNFDGDFDDPVAMSRQIARLIAD